MDFKRLEIIELKKGAHESPASGLCAMEAVAWLEGLEHSDHPKCTCPVIAAYVITINDRFNNEDRQRLVAYLPKLVGTVGTEQDKIERGRVFAQAAGEVFAYKALLAAGMKDHAEKVAAAFKSRDWGAASGAAADAAWAARAADAVAYAAARAAYAARAAWTAGAAAARAAYAAGAARADDAAGDIDDALMVLDIALAVGPQSPYKGEK